MRLDSHIGARYLPKMNALHWLLLLFTFLAAVALTGFFASPRSPCYVLDHPGPRSLHAAPTPRTGGLAFLLAILASALCLSVWIAPPPLAGWLAAAGGLLALVGLWDDLHDVRPLYRLLVQLLAALILIRGGLSVERLVLPGWELVLPEPVNTLLTLGFVAWMTNLYNFMDGMDGLAGGMAVMGFGCIALSAAALEASWFGSFNGLVVAAVAGFLVWNLPPARIFMGDVGSSLLGFLAAAMLLWGHRDGILPLWIGLLIFSPFLFDATWTLVRRLLRGERVWEAHRSHYYQRLVVRGWGRGRVLLSAYLLMAGCAASALWLPRLGVQSQWLVLGVWCLVYLGIIIGMGFLCAGDRSTTA
jgi:UDP-N-acetylmuramyl pentapeptide phosphotransferase/UDP-N-acetylglucosamine-1-phosphate transferase